MHITLEEMNRWAQGIPLGPENVTRYLKLEKGDTLDSGRIWRGPAVLEITRWTAHHTRWSARELKVLTPGDIVG